MSFKLFGYDKTSPESILRYAKNLVGKTFFDIKKCYFIHFNKSDELEKLEEEVLTDSNAKGELGNFLEKYYFDMAPNSRQEPDFKEAGVELKQTCIDRKKNGDYTAGERLSITNISYEDPVETDFYKSHVWEKIRLILLVHYIRDKSVQRLLNKITHVNLFTPPRADLEIIITDYNKIIRKIAEGKAHELSESDTLYLGACTKGSTAAKSLRPQYYGDHTPAKKRNFCFKRSYMDYVLHTYVLNDAVPYETIIDDIDTLKTKTFEEIVLERINRHIGLTDMELCSRYDRPYNNNKAQWSDLAYRMLGIKGNHAEEFVKANIVVKSIRIETNGKINECMSFPPFRFLDFVQEEWENSEIYQYFSETRFLFVIYKKSGTEYVLQNAQMWNMPMSDLDGIVQEGWKNIQNCIKNGVTFTVRPNGNVLNNIPGITDNPVIHVRPHSKKAAYKLANGFTKGNVERDANPLPDGQWMTTQSFWINNSYIADQITHTQKSDPASSPSVRSD